MKPLKNKTYQEGHPVVLITGALSGIGKATAFSFAKAGYNVVVSGRHLDDGCTLEKDLLKIGPDAKFIYADIRHESEVRNLIDQTILCFGRLDSAINNAGSDGKFQSILKHDADSYHHVFDVNVLGTFLCMKHELRVMRDQGFGSIVNLSSTMGTKATLNSSIYTGSKHAVEGMTKAVALEAAPLGIRVNAIAPGPVQTEMFNRVSGGDEGKAEVLRNIPMRRIGNVEEIAEMIVFAASDKVPFLTGEIIRVNGGKTA